ncbi:MAG: aromatic amino acid lyase, partial [Methanomassiliicoccales archaeon]|nr:aromatic amino acid lyase [Methanomassiliicoccales archaeon]
PTSANQEDYNSMGSVGALRLTDLVRNTERIVAIELLCAAQALEFAKFEPGRGVQAAYALVRSTVPPLEEDRPLSHDIEKIREMIADGSLVRAAQKASRFRHA